jgi:hypothetical protein
LISTGFDSPPLTEKSVLGGTSNVVARAYVFQVCPFKNVTQREADHMEWKRATARAEGKKLKRSKAVWKSTSGVGSTPSRHRAGVASMAWAAPFKFDFYTGPRRPNLLSWVNSRSGRRRGMTATRSTTRSTVLCRNQQLLAPQKLIPMISTGASWSWPRRLRMARGKYTPAVSRARAIGKE